MSEPRPSAEGIGAERVARLARVLPRWPRCIVAGSGPSLAQHAEQAAAAGWPIIAVNDAYRLLPDAEILYACDALWWDVHGGCAAFRGDKWSSHGLPNNDKREAQRRWGLNLVAGAERHGFSRDPARIHYGSNSGFQAINLAILFGATSIVLVGFDMRINGKRHFFGDHPEPLKTKTDYGAFIPEFNRAAALLAADVAIINATPESALTCFPRAGLSQALGLLAA